MLKLAQTCSNLLKDYTNFGIEPGSLRLTSARLANHTFGMTAKAAEP